MKHPHPVSMPSPVSDWLEQQLEARGIDSEVYTRYILSLLHAHTLDFIYPEEDFSFFGLKDGARTVVTHKRLRRIGTWWKHAQADAEQIRRSAAVECLMSATEQSCEVESLVDELCEKLKDINSDNKHFSNKATPDTKVAKGSPKERNVSSKELAEQYYAAFPPLHNYKEDNSYLSPKWPIPDKSHIDLIAAKWTTAGSPKKSKRKPKRQIHAPAMKPTSRMTQGRNRFGHKRTHSGRNLTREMTDNIANWEFVHNNNNYQIPDQRLDFFDPEMVPVSSEDVDMCEMDENDPPICRMKLWLKNAGSEKVDLTNKTNSSFKRTRLYEREAKYIPLYPTTIWSDNNAPSNDQWANSFADNQEESRKYNPDKGTHSPWILEEETAIRDEYQRWAADGEVECAIKTEYDRPHELCCHRVGYSDSYFDINCNEATVDIGGMHSSNRLPSQVDNDVFNSELQKQDDELLMQNHTNNVLEDLNRQGVVPTACKCCDRTDHWWINDALKVLDFNTIFDDKTISLMRINHSLENSAFCEYNPSLSFNIVGSGAFKRQLSRQVKEQQPFSQNSSPPKWPIVPPLRVSEEQKLSSPDMYFEPIKSLPLEKSKENNIALKDGFTFNIKASPDQVKFQRTDTGSLLLETEFGELKKYFEYKWRPPSAESAKLLRMRSQLSECEEFKIKYWVSPNDKSCQTVEAPSLMPIDEDMVEMSVPAVVALQSTNFVEGTEGDEARQWVPSQIIDMSKEGENQDDFERHDSLSETDDIVWRYPPNNSDVFCKHCNVKHSWPNNSLKSLDDIDWDERTLKDIWGGTEPCDTCPWSTKVPTPLAENTTKLREESKEEAERLLSDLSSLQLSYSAKLLEDPSKTNEGPCEKRRRHSYITNDSGLWSFTTRLEEDCLISLSTLPTRSSVTL